MPESTNPTSEAPVDIENMLQRIPHYRSLLSSFAASKSTFKVLASVPSDISSSPTSSSKASGVLKTPPKTLHVLDSSFNPPTLAHLRIALSSLTSTTNTTKPNSSPRRLVLLLATQNADKAPKPAPFEERLCMMEIFAQEVLSKIYSESQAEDINVDIAVTKYPYFVDKAKDMEVAEIYARESGEVAEQVHLIGYDTIIRLLSPKYYPPKHNLESLVPFLEKHRLEVTYRTDDSWGGKDEQDNFLSNLREGRMKVVDGMAATPALGESLEDGSLSRIGGRTEWFGEGKCVMFEGRKEGEETVSSTKVREAAQRKDREALEKLVTKGISRFILERELYNNE
ncbi:Nucleotidylyl transferase [Glarea lozoyensis ATCC 20868]|uniref:Nucleotidylyl transferase n=1 Tax=Glarea lozoyensis (strain ATCC 20868 / MF5171) TaxID=1116229 RepID=S3DIB6_GLAL2|nr:Nucleotidylyl transferase [Glarea lozoyensis ATCC 20868]EPE36894.1 Nucleotidylyl transferase [Glarea lozoyensis ATCC 20868]